MQNEHIILTPVTAPIDEKSEVDSSTNKSRVNIFLKNKIRSNELK